MTTETIAKPTKAASAAPSTMALQAADVSTRIAHSLIKLRMSPVEDRRQTIADVHADLCIAQLSCDALLAEIAKESQREATIARQSSLLEQCRALVEHLLGSGAIDARHMPDTHPRACGLLVLLSGEDQP